MGIKKHTKEESDVAVAKKTALKVEPPKMYQVILLNDDYTTMEFVIHVLQKFFGKTYDQAHAIMLLVHHEGRGVCGIYTHEVAESKASKVNKYSRNKGHPLKCVIEENPA